MNTLLIGEPPLQVLPSLAVEVGLNEAVVLQQVHYWLLRSNNVQDGYKWVYNSYSEWNKQFPFWSRNTLIRTFNRLEKQGYLISANYNKAGFDKTKWYRIDYERLNKASTQNEQTKSPKWINGMAQNGQTNTNRLPENTTETTTNKKGPAKAEPPYKEIIDYLNNKTKTTHYRPTSKATQKLIRARWNEGYGLDDFKKVIDNQAFAWQGTEFWKYMRPSTLFNASKFEGYLNANDLNRNKDQPVSSGFETNVNIMDIPDDQLPF